MPIDYVDAQDEMYALLLAAWNANTPAIVGYVPELRYQNVEIPTKPDSSKYWARLSIQTVTEGQTTLSSSVVSDGHSRYTTNGLIFVQIFAPLSDSLCGRNGQLISQVAKKAFRGHTTSGKVWFRNGRIQELPNDSQSVRFNVVTEYQYDELS